MQTPYCEAVGAATTLIAAVPVIVAVAVSVTVNVSLPRVVTVAVNEAMPLLKVRLAGTVTLESLQVTVAVPE